MGKVEEGTGGINDDGRRLDLGGKHTIQYTDDMLSNCTPHTYIILLTSITPINLIKIKKKLCVCF